MISSPDSDRHFAGLYARTLLELVEWRLGADGAARVVADAGDRRSVADLHDDATWSSYDQFRALLQASARALGSPDELRLVGEIPSIGVGSKPEITALLQAYGSPLNMAVTMAGGGMSPILDLEFTAIGPAELGIGLGLADGSDGCPELCAFVAGLMPLSVRIFGMRVLEVCEDTCRHRGDDRCFIRIRWDEAQDLALQLEFAHFRLGIAETRLASFQRTVGDIVSTDDLDSVLGRIVDAAARSTTASGFVLEVDALPGDVRRYADGVDDEDAAAMVRRAAAGEAGYLAVDVASNHRRYGRLVVLDTGGNLDFERPALEGYARLAATALDSAFALEEARRQATMSGALLELSKALAEISTADEVAAKVVQALPSVIDSDCAALLLVRDGIARVAAHHGFEPSKVAEVEAAEIVVDESAMQADGVIVRTTDDASPVAATVMASMHLQASAAAPIRVDDTLIGFLVAGVRQRPERVVDDALLQERLGGLAAQAAVALCNGQLLDQIRYQSQHDSLTDLPNRALIMDRAERMMARARRSGRPAAVLFIDLDGFKEINDTLGHGAGDELLKIVARRLHATVRGGDTVGRLGGDEFVVLVEDAESDAGVEAIAARLLAVLREPLDLDGRDRPMVVQASIGIACDAAAAAGDLLRDADIALYRAKGAGKGCYRVFVPELLATNASTA